MTSTTPTDPTTFLASYAANAADAAGEKKLVALMGPLFKYMQDFISAAKLQQQRVMSEQKTAHDLQMAYLNRLETLNNAFGSKLPTAKPKQPTGPTDSKDAKDTSKVCELSLMVE